MANAPFIPDNAPFTPEQRAWLNGFLAGVFSRQTSSTPAAAAAAPALQPLTILFGSQTGSAEGLAKRAAKEAGKRGFAPMVLDMAQVDLPRLAQEKNLLVITSTYGDGEPPDNAKALWEALGAEGGPGLATVRFSVCALGDTNYTMFCQCGKDFDSRLEKRGATRVAARVDCDLEYEEPFTKWLGASLTALAGGTGAPAQPTHAAVADTVAEAAPSAYSRKNPYYSKLLVSKNLNAEGSAKSVHHIEFCLKESGLVYQVGDALGVIPQNCPELVSDVLAVLGCDGEEAVANPAGGTMPLRQALTNVYDLGKPSAELIAAVAAAVPVGASGATGAPHHVIDVLTAYPEFKFTPDTFIGVLKKIQPRLYSISSSSKAHSDSVHLTVGAVRYEHAGRKRKGVCSTFLAERAVPEQTTVGIFVHSNNAFRPPADANLPMIMVGPGTGIAPFRAFLQDRAAQGAKGKNWLFFGDQKASTDFLYREQLQQWKDSGLLTRLDTAFSRDQTEKVYVQHRMLEQAAELYAWLEQGAHFYVCGDAARMAKDVDQALHEVIAKASGRTAAEAADYVQKLKASKRYARDVY